jgi:quinoprotein glucose dehydrogenase
MGKAAIAQRQIASMCLACALLASTEETNAKISSETDWPYYGGDKHFTRYSPLGQLNKDNIAGLRVLWERPSLDAQLLAQFPEMIAPRYFMATPIVVDGTVYSPNGVGLIEAFDGLTGKTRWVQQPFTGDTRELTGRATRGASFWRSGRQRRIVSVRGEYLYSLDATSGRPDAAFGQNGRVSLRRVTADATPYTTTGGPIVVGDVIVVGGNGGSRGEGDGGQIKESTPASVRAYDVRTGKQLWEVSPRPSADDPARKSWGSDAAAAVAGDMAVWGQMSADEELGLVYLPFTAPGLPGWGGWRPGDNKYSETLMAVRATSGKIAWRFQMIHHDLWDLDLAAPPVLGDIIVDGRHIKAVMQTGKNAILYTLDRQTGKPVWPIVERPVPASTVPGERASPTQPMPLKPAPFDRQGLSEDDLIDFTPELRAEAREFISHYVYGPPYTPPSIISTDPQGTKGTLVLPGTHGGGSWNTGAFDPETQTYYAASHTIVGRYGLRKPTNPKATVEYEVVEDNGMFVVTLPSGLPLVKPPYGRITAIDMNRGEIRWVVANGDGPRNHPLLKSLHLPPLGTPGRPALLVTKTLLFAGEGSDVVNYSKLAQGYGPHFRAYDKASGEVLADVLLPTGTTGAPITYTKNGKQMILVAVGSSDYAPEWVALGL